MKFVDDVAWKIWQLETEDGIYYRTNDSGSNWERLYGDSWETVQVLKRNDVKRHGVNTFLDYHIEEFDR